MDHNGGLKKAFDEMSETLFQGLKLGGGVGGGVRGRGGCGGLLRRQTKADEAWRV